MVAKAEGESHSKWPGEEMRGYEGFGISCAVHHCCLSVNCECE